MAPEALARLETRLARLNPAATRFHSPPLPGLADLIQGDGAFANAADLRPWFATVDGLAGASAPSLAFGCHDASINSLAMKAASVETRGPPSKARVL